MALPDGTERTVVVGLDGATFSLLSPWLEAGELPTLKRIVDDGVSGDLTSVLPPITSPNWKAYSTGQNPGKLGIFWWRNVDVENQETYVPSEKYTANTEFWELIAEETPVGVIGTPMTHPPKSLNGFVVPGGPRAGRSGLTTHPPELADDLAERFDYSASLDHSLYEETAETFAEVHDHIDTNFAAAKYLMDRYDVSFLQVTTFQINLLHHHLWDHDETLAGWKIIDDHLESFLDDETNVVLMSDHGMANIESTFRINRWLQEQGYLSYDAGASSTLYDLGLTTGSLKTILKQVDRQIPTVDVSQLVSDIVPQQLLNHLPDERGELGASKFSQINWEESDAIASAQGPIYLTADRGTAEYDRIREELTERLSGLTDPQGRAVVDDVHLAEDVYAGQYLDDAPDILLDQAEGTYIVEGLGERDVFGEDDEVWEGVNARTGLFAAAGPEFRSGTVDDLSILDLAPTLLHLHDRAIPTNIDGEVRTDLFEQGSQPANREPRYDTPRESAATDAADVESEAMREQLEDLGYI
jgi:predicted AlkP superfamily phosphohydrolase/phosphomutase